MNNTYNNYQNNLIRGYTNTVNNNTYTNNPMLANNPRINTFMNNNSLQERIKMEKLDQLRKAKNIKDLGMNEQDIITYTINPFKIEKVDDREKEIMMNKYKEMDNVYDELKKYKNEQDAKKGVMVSQSAPIEIVNLWRSRKNNPYKKILWELDIKDYTEKKYEKQGDLIVNRLTQLDKCEDILNKELSRLEKKLEKHDMELGEMFSKKKMKKFLEQFEYESKHRNKINYDPKNCAELKEIYKNTQKKLEKHTRRIDDMLEMMMLNEELSKEDIDELKKIREMTEKEIKNNDMEILLDKEIEKEMKQNTIITTEKNLEDKYANRNKNKDSNEVQEDQPKKRIVIKKTISEHNNFGTISQSKLNKYENR